MSIWTKITDFFKDEGHEIEEIFDEFERDLLKRVHPLASQMYKVFGHQALEIAKQILEASFIAVGTGGNWAVAIADAAPKLMATIKTDLHEDLHNATYGALAIAQGELMANGVGATPACAAATPPTLIIPQETVN